MSDGATETGRPPGNSIRIGTRGSRLARWQAEWVADRLRRLHPGLAVELVEIKTHGDRDRNSPLAAIGGTGLFTKEIQRALLDGPVEVAVHSLKDLPTPGPGGLILAAVPPREDVADALIAPDPDPRRACPRGPGRHRLAPPPGAAAPPPARPDVVENPGQRRDPAEPGPRRARSTPSSWPRRASTGSAWTSTSPSGSGRRGSCRPWGRGPSGSNAGATMPRPSLARPAGRRPTHRAVTAERTVLAELGGGCMIPLAASAAAESAEQCTLSAVVLDPDGRERLDAAETGPTDDPEGLGRWVAERLRQGGADRILGLSR